MTQEERQLLLRDICMRLPYGVKLLYNSNSIANIKDRVEILRGITIGYTIWFETNYDHYEYESTSGSYEHFKPYLRPMSSMTKEEKEELESISSLYFNDALDAQIRESLKGENKDGSRILEYVACTKVTDWLLEHHFDIHGLIEKGLAIEATEEMYNFKK